MSDINFVIVPCHPRLYLDDHRTIRLNRRPSSVLTTRHIRRMLALRCLLKHEFQPMSPRNAIFDVCFPTAMKNRITLFWTVFMTLYCFVPHTPLQYINTGSTTVSYNLVNTSYVIPPTLMNLPINAPSAREADFANSFTALSILKCSSNHKPRYLYESVLSISLSPHLNSKSVCCIDGGRKCTTFDFCGLIARPHMRHQSETISNIDCKLFGSGAIKAMSSAYNKILIMFIIIIVIIDILVSRSKVKVKGQVYSSYVGEGGH